jgi:CBS domain-containing protein
VKNVADILKVKGSDVFSVTPETTVYEALEHMAEKNIGALLVIENERVVGILSERDYARKVALQGKASNEIPVKQIMSTRVAFIPPERTLEECMALMTDKHFRHLPVMDDDRLAGVISIGDVVKALIDQKSYEIKQLEDYIRGTY